MAAQDIAAALQRVEAVLLRRPEAGLHEDAPATAHWAGGTRVVTHHANGAQVQTDMPDELGGHGEHTTPGWLLRAGVASCTVTCIAMVAATEGIDLEAVEVHTTSQSDLRGLLGLNDADGQAISARPLEMQLQVRIRAPGVAPDRLRALVEDATRMSPMSCAIQEPVPFALHIDAGSA
jgi:organic hydroperoxide reductase OsmC/OhrA